MSYPHYTRPKKKGRSCNILLPGTQVHYLTKISSEEDFERRLEAVWARVKGGLDAEGSYMSVPNPNPNLNPNLNPSPSTSPSPGLSLCPALSPSASQGLALVLDGPSLKYFRQVRGLGMRVLGGIVIYVTVMGRVKGG